MAASGETYNIGDVTINWNANSVVYDIHVACSESMRKASNIVMKAAKRIAPMGDVARSAYKTGPNANKRWTARIPGTLKKSGYIKRTKKTQVAPNNWQNIQKNFVKYQVVFGGVEQSAGAKIGIADTGGRLGQRLAYYARFAHFGVSGKVRSDAGKGRKWKKRKYTGKPAGSRYPIPSVGPIAFLYTAFEQKRAEILMQFQNAMGKK